MALISEVAQICSFICSEMSLCQSLSYILAVLNLRFFSLTPTLCCQIQNGLTAKRIEIQTPATSQMKDILTLFLNINKLPPLEKRNIRMNTRETNSFFFRYCYSQDISFLDAPRISMRGSVCPSVRWSVGPSVRWSVGPLVRHAFVKKSKMGKTG